MREDKLSRGGFGNLNPGIGPSIRSIVGVQHRSRHSIANEGTEPQANRDGVGHSNHRDRTDGVPEQPESPGYSGEAALFTMIQRAMPATAEA